MRVGGRTILFQGGPARVRAEALDVPDGSPDGPEPGERTRLWPRWLAALILAVLAALVARVAVATAPDDVVSRVERAPAQAPDPEAVGPP
jgi:hypothetical protein